MPYVGFLLLDRFCWQKGYSIVAETDTQSTQKIFKKYILHYIYQERKNLKMKNTT